MKRLFVQIATTFLSNPLLGNFFKGTIHQGASKKLCVPGLNCYSCPGAALSCPIGSLQAVLSGPKNFFSYYIVGTLIFFSVLFGRLICGFLCPFGFVQDLLFKIPVKKKKISEKIDRPLRKLKYILLIVFVILFPLFVTNSFGLGDPTFCKYFCPVGILEGAFPLLATNPVLRQSIGFLFYWKLAITLLVLVSSLFIYRPFCKYLCPLGAIYGLFNSFSFYQMEIDKSTCIDCKICEKNCPMNVPVLEKINHPECVRCMTCKDSCPVSCIHSGFSLGESVVKGDLPKEEETVFD